MNGPLLLGALVAALLGSPHCVGMCGPLLGATGRAGPAWHLGRLATYTSLGALAGGAGSARMLGGTVAPILSVLLLAWFALRLGGWLPAPAGQSAGWLVATGAKLLKRGGPFGHFGFGALSGLLPCGLVWSSLALGVAGGGAAGGALVMVAFWTGTLPALSVATVALRRLTAARPWTRRLVAVGVLASGLFSIALRSQPSDDGVPPCHAVAG